MSTPPLPTLWEPPRTPGPGPVTPAGAGTVTADPYAPPAGPGTSGRGAPPPHEPPGEPYVRGPFLGTGAPGDGTVPPPGYGAAGPPVRRGPGGLAVAGLVLGCCALALLSLDAWLASGVVSGVGLGLAVVGLVLGVVGLATGRSVERHHGVGVAGVTTSSVAAVLATTVLVAAALGLAPWLGAGAGVVEWPLLSLRPGEPAAVGDYTVTVDEIQMDADAALAADRANPPAEGRYVQAVVTVVYEGTGIGIVGEDLLVSYVGSDYWLYDEWGCAATTDRPVGAVGPLSPGEQATFVACMDVPVEVVRDTAVVVEDLGSWEMSAELWGVR